MTTATLAAPNASVASAAPAAAPPPATYRTPRPHRHTVKHIEGRYRAIPARYLATTAWLYSHGVITRRQLRIVFALCEMAEQRRYAKKETAKERPVYLVEQVATLVGGRGSATALRDLRADIRALAALGLVRMEEHAIHFAKNTSDLTMGEGRGETLDAFLASNKGIARTVPAPRRTIRALAAGFNRAETLYIVAALIRSVFRDRKTGLISIDGRMKGSWVAEAFDLSRRSVTAARRKLIELGWLRPLEVHQVAANKWGVHDVVNVHWKPVREGEAIVPTEASTGLPTDSVDKLEGAGRSASPQRQNTGESASPINRETLPTEDPYTRKLGVPTPDPAWSGSREGVRGRGAVSGAPTLRDVSEGDLRDTDRLLALHEQAVAAGYTVKGESGRMAFLAMANRALTRGKNPGGLLLWLLKRQKDEFITQADDDAAQRRWQAHQSKLMGLPKRVVSRPNNDRGLTEDELFVEGCIRGVKRHRGLDPFLVAERGKGWSREQWDRTRCSYERKQAEQWAVHEPHSLLEGHRGRTEPLLSVPGDRP